MSKHGTFHWNELMSRDVERDKQFYSDTIGWSFEGMPMAHEDGRSTGARFRAASRSPVCSSIASPEFDGVPVGWMSYLAVDDVDARAEQALKAGAQLMRPIFDVPEVGRIAILREPGGAGVGWMTPVGM